MIARDIVEMLPCQERESAYVVNWSHFSTGAWPQNSGNRSPRPHMIASSGREQVWTFLVPEMRGRSILVFGDNVGAINLANNPLGPPSFLERTDCVR